MALDRLVDDLGDVATVSSLLEHYLAELTEREQAIRDAILACDDDVLHRIGHTLRSTSEMFGLHALADLCRQLEMTSADRDAASLLERFAAAAQSARQYIQSWIDDRTKVGR
jgi:HPt (histidine-containing phosphotransfer) domain-containing protein